MIKTIGSRAFFSALGVAVYVSLLGWGMTTFGQHMGPKPDSWISGGLFLLIFLVSACVTGSLILLNPILFYLEGRKKDGIRLFLTTVAFLVIFAALIIVALWRNA